MDGPGLTLGLDYLQKRLSLAPRSEEVTAGADCSLGTAGVPDVVTLNPEQFLGILGVCAM